jgi:xanthine dehydrogenase accessory factor
MKDAYAVAIVVAREAPVSSHVGDRAIVHADGRMEGFIGGACSREIIRSQALRALRSGAPVLVRIRADADETPVGPEIVTAPLTCVSEGAVDVYIEPHVPRRTLLIAGLTPVARALAELAPLLDFDAVCFVDGQELRDAEFTHRVEAFAIETLDPYLQNFESERRERCVAIAASQGDYDERALGAFLKHDVGFVGLLASPKRAAAVRATLLQEGTPPERVRAIRSPIGLAIGARKPAEVAVSIFAEIIANPPVPLEFPASIDPVCGMSVDMTAARHHTAVGDRTYYFCSAHCRDSFLEDPQQYLAAVLP